MFSHEGPEGERPDEAVRVRGGDHGDPGPEPGELTKQVDRVVGGDAAGDAQDQLFVLEAHGFAVLSSVLAVLPFESLGSVGMPR